jgi:hypothetical protein
MNQWVRRSRRGAEANRPPTFLKAFLCLLIAGAASAVRAQPAAADLSGVVLDENQALVTGVNITALNLSDAVQRRAVTDGNGRFVIPLLSPGRYHLIAERDGFTTLEIRDLRLEPHEQLALRVRLKVGGVGEYITIVESGLGLQPSASFGAVVERRLVERLPFNGGSALSLLELLPGAAPTRARFQQQGQFSVNGQRANANYFTVDGVSANVGVSAGPAPGQAAGGSLPALTAFGSAHNLVSREAIEEARLQSASFAPEFGRSGGGQVALVTRSGGKEYRGALFGELRHEALAANDWFANQRGFGRAPLRHQDVGAVFGGPLSRERAFFFLSYETLRLRQPRVAVTDVPTLETRETALAQVRPLLRAFPLPNGAVAPDGLAEFAAHYSDPADLRAASLRIDHAVNGKLVTFGRFNDAPSRTRQRGGDMHGYDHMSLNTISLASFHTRNLTLGASFAPAPNLVNELRVNGSWARGTASFAMDDFGGARPLPDAMLFPPFVPRSEAGFRFLFRGKTGSNLAVGKSVDNLQRQVNLVDHFSLTAGAHQMKFGLDYRRLAPTYGPLAYYQSVTFGGVLSTALTATAYSVTVAAGDDPRLPLFTNVSAFAQDTWRAGPRLTLTYGLRWEFNPPPTERRGRHPLVVDGLGAGDDSTESGTAMKLAPRGTPLWRTTYRDFAPRLGVAYQLAPERGATLRAGAGVFYDLGHDHAAQAFGSVFPYVSAKRLYNVPFPLRPEDAATLPPGPLKPPYGTLYAFDPKLKLPYTIQWNLTLEQPLGRDQTLTASYVAALGRRLLHEKALVFDHFIALEPRKDGSPFTTVYATSNAADSDYHALQLQFQRRFARGLQAQAAYTWSRSLDTSSSDSVGALRARWNQQWVKLDQGRGPSDFDARQAATVVVSYDLPPAGAGVFGRAVLRDWSVDAIFRARSAAPVNVTIGLILPDLDLPGILRPDLVPGAPLYLKDATAPGGWRINRAAFLIPAGRQGTVGRNALRGFGFAQADVALHRQFALTERLRLRLRAECFNLFNRSNFGEPVNDLNSRFFGQAVEMLGRNLGSGGVSGGLSPLYQIGGPRSLQLAAKLQF